MSLKPLKRYARRRLLDLCVWLNDLSRWIQKKVLYTTLEKEHCEINLNTPFGEMDEDLLGIFIRWNGHHVEKTVRYERTSGRGFSKPALLRGALDEWHRRQYPSRRWIQWAEENLRDYETWLATGQPQLHPARQLPIYTPESPIMEVLKNRVSTRYWTDAPVENEKVQTILEAAGYAPTCCNRQTWKLYVKRNEVIKDVKKVDNATLREKAPVAIYITIDQRLYPEHFAAAEDAGIIGLQLSLAATSLGLAGVLMYGADNFDQESFRRTYNVPRHRYMYLMFLFGYAAERTLTEKRVHGEEIAIFI